MTTYYVKRLQASIIENGIDKYYPSSNDTAYGNNQSTPPSSYSQFFLRHRFTQAFIDEQGVVDYPETRTDYSTKGAFSIVRYLGDAKNTLIIQSIPEYNNFSDNYLLPCRTTFGGLLENYPPTIDYTQYIYADSAFGATTNWGSVGWSNPAAGLPTTGDFNWSDYSGRDISTFENQLCSYFERVRVIYPSLHTGTLDQSWPFFEVEGVNLVLFEIHYKDTYTPDPNNYYSFFPLFYHGDDTNCDRIVEI